VQNALNQPYFPFWTENIHSHSFLECKKLALRPYLLRFGMMPAG